MTKHELNFAHRREKRRDEKGYIRVSQQAKSLFSDEKGISYWRHRPQECADLQWDLRTPRRHGPGMLPTAAARQQWLRALPRSTMDNGPGRATANSVV